MLTSLRIAAFGCLLFLQAQAQITNHVEIVPRIYFDLCKASSGKKSEVFRSDEIIHYALTSPSTQAVHVARLPKEQTFVFTLYDTNGNIAPKTQLGIENSKLLDVAKILSEIKSNNAKLTDQQLAYHLAAIDLKLKHEYISSTKSYAWEVLKPDDYFVITNKGIYTLEVQMRLWAQKTNGQYGVVLSPPVRVQVERK